MTKNKIINLTAFGVMTAVTIASIIVIFYVILPHNKESNADLQQSVSSVITASSDTPSESNSTISENVSFESSSSKNSLVSSSSQQQSTAPEVHEPENPQPEEITPSETEQIDILFETQKQLFISQYNSAEAEYISELNKTIAANNTRISQLSNEVDGYSANKILAQYRLREQYANMGMLNSGQYNFALNNSNNYYDNLISSCNSQIRQLEAENKTLNSELQNPDINQILAIVAVRNGYTAQEVIENYELYMD